MISIRLQNLTRTFIAVVALAGIGSALVTVPTAEAAGIRNCVDITGRQSGHVGCYENVWADGAQYRMTFSNQGFDGATPRELDPFYVLAPQTDAPQGYPPNTFPHDHVVRAIPAGNEGSYSVRLQGYFVACSAQGLTTGACVPTWTSLGGPDPLPFATTVDGQPLTSAEAIEAAADAGDLALIHLGPGAVIVGTISGR